MSATLYLGTHRPQWLERGLGVPLFVSRRQIAHRRRLPVADTPWVLDSGGFTELQAGRWSITTAQYADEVERIQRDVGMLDWAAPMDWMCEPGVREQTGLSTAEHQALTIESFLDLRARLGSIVVPVLQGWLHDDYLAHVAAYHEAGVDLHAERVIGVGSICRRNSDDDICGVVRELASGGLRLHGFGVRGTAYRLLRGVLASADSMAWSIDGRYNVLEGCTHRSCANCERYALRWHHQLATGIPATTRTRRVFARRPPTNGQEAML